MASSKAERGNPLGPLVPVFLILILGGLVAGGYWFVRNHKRLFVREPHQVEIIDPSKDLRPVEPPPPKPVEVKEEPPPPPPPPKPKVKSLDELKAEAAEASKRLAAALEAAKAEKVPELPGFAGLRFGDVLKGAPLREVALPEGGIALVLQGKPLEKSFRSFDRAPLIWVTPKSRRIFRIELKGAVKAGAEGPAAETTNTVAAIAKYAKREALSADDLPLVERVWYFPAGETRFEVREEGGVRLVLVAEHAGLRRTVAEESVVLTREEKSVEGASRALGSSKYPNGGVVRLRGVRVKDATPRSFCGVVFGTSAPPGVRMTNPKGGERGFFIDYRRQTCLPFLDFDHGKVSVSRQTGAAYAVELYSDGPSAGLSEEDYVHKVRSVIERFYKVKAESSAEDSRSFTLTRGDFRLAFAPDAAGGYRLRADVSKYE